VYLHSYKVWAIYSAVGVKKYEHAVLLGDFTKLRKVTISFVLSFRLSVPPSVHMKQLGSHRTDFHEIWYSSIFR